MELSGQGTQSWWPARGLSKRRFPATAICVLHTVCASCGVCGTLFSVGEDTFVDGKKVLRAYQLLERQGECSGQLQCLARYLCMRPRHCIGTTYIHCFKLSTHLSDPCQINIGRKRSGPAVPSTYQQPTHLLPAPTMSGKDEDRDHPMAEGGDDDSGDSGDDSSSSSSDEEVEVDARDMDQMMKLEASLEGNANQYDAHLEVSRTCVSLCV
jgi:hypothetical protein